MSNEAPTDALRLVPDDQVRKLATQLASSIAGLGYPVGLGIAPPEDVCMKAAQGVFDLYLAAPASPLPGGGWQDISTAPKDGTEIIVWATNFKPGHPVVVKWSLDKYAQRPIPRWETRDPIYGRRSFIDRPPTHWQPLPAAPTGEPK